LSKQKHEHSRFQVDWSLFGRPPPRTHADWEKEFDKYKLSPEFKYKNSEISIEDFKFIW
jgi:cytochrome c oxidase assembly protein subunit 15